MSKYQSPKGYLIVGNCPQCGCPIYVKEKEDGSVPESIKTCICLPYAIYPTFPLCPAPESSQPWITYIDSNTADLGDRET